jgi:hypothetical protein
MRVAQAFAQPDPANYLRACHEVAPQLDDHPSRRRRVLARLGEGALTDLSSCVTATRRLCPGRLPPSGAANRCG